MCSRRQADRLINEGRVTLNGKPTKPGNRVSPGDVVLVDAQNIKPKKRAIYIALNKPVGVVCTNDQREPDNIIRFMDYPQRLFPIGRLDKASEGLIFLTNDGDIVNKILRAGNQHEKEYIVEVNRQITNSFIDKMAAGVPILDTVTKKCVVEKIDPKTFKIILVQGLNRQIRRMCDHLGYKVKNLQRTRIMNVSLGSIKIGKWRHLNKSEMMQINKMVENSVNS